MDVFEAAQALSNEVERENEKVDASGRVTGKQLTMVQHLQLHPSARLKVIVVDCTPRAARFQALARFAPDPLGKVRQLRYRGFEVQLKVRGGPK